VKEDMLKRRLARRWRNQKKEILNTLRRRTPYRQNGKAPTPDFTLIMCFIKI
jgi:ribose 1,5-bisphosphokinase PhnN